MTPKDILGLIVRLFGLLTMIYGIYTGSFTVLHLIGFVSESFHHETASFIFFAIFCLFGGFIIVRKTEKIENFCYPLDKERD